MPPEAQPALEAAPEAPAPAAPPRRRAFYEQHKAALWALGLGLPVLVVAVGWAVRPDIFYDRFIWQHLWGSTVADATQRGLATWHGITVTDDYTLVSEVVYGAILAVSLYGIYAHVIKRFGVKVDAWFVAAILPFILFGPVTRSLEDTSMFCRAGTAGPAACEPGLFAYPFVSPFLYAQIAVYVLAFMVAGALMQRSGAPEKAKRAAMAGLLGASFAAYGMVWAALSPEFTALAHPAVVLVACLLGLGVFAALDRRWSDVNRALLGGGVAFLLPPVWMVGTWLGGARWGPSLGALHLEATPWILGLPLLCVLALLAVGVAGRRVNPRLAAYAVPLNLGLVYGHMLDGFASFIAICSSRVQGTCYGAAVFGLDLPSYGEKHPVSNALLGVLDGWLFPIVKLGLVAVLIWVLDVDYRKELQKEPQLAGLVKMAILVLGLAPGLRDYLRLAMGV